MYAATWAKKRWRREGRREGRSVAGSGRSASALMMQWNLSLLICVQNPICIASFHSSKRSLLLQRDRWSFFSLATAQRKSTISLCGCSCPSCEDERCFTLFIYTKRRSSCEGSLPLWAGTGFSSFDILPCCCTAGDAFLVARQGFGPHSHTHTHPILFTSCTSLKLAGVCVCVELGVWVCACMCGGVLARWPDAVCWPCPALINML